MKSKRLLSVILAVAMMLTTLPLTMATALSAADSSETSETVGTIDLAEADFTGAQSSSRNYNFQEGNKYMYVSGRKELGESKLYIYSFGFSDATYTIQYDIASPFTILNATLDSNAGRFYSSGLGKNPNNVLYLRGRDSNWYTVTGHNYVPLGSDVNNLLNIGARPPFYGWNLNNGADFDGYDFKIDNIKLVNEAGVTVFNFDFDTVEATGGGGTYYMTVEDTVIDGVTYKGGTLVLQNYNPIRSTPAEDLRANLSIVTDETYYAASTDANHEVTYDYNETLAAGVYTFKATVRNGEYILAASSAADGTTNYIVYDSANYGLLVENNNKFDLGFNLYTAGGEVIKADAVVTDIGNDWTEVEFSFEINKATTIEKLAFEAHHVLENETITMVEFPATTSGAKFTAEQVAAANEKLNARTQTVMLNFKDVAIEYEVYPSISSGLGFTGAQSSSRNYNFQEGNKYMYVSNRTNLGESKLYIYSFGFSDATYTIQYDIATPFSLTNATGASNAGRFYSSGFGKNANNNLYLRGIDARWYTVTGHNYLPLGSDMNNMLNIGARHPFYGWGLNNGPEFDGYDYKIDNIKLVNEAGVTVFNFDFDNVVATGGGGVYYMTVEDTEIDGVTYKGGTLVLQNYAPLGTPVAEEFRPTLSVRTDETYYIATTDANHEVVYDYNMGLDAGYYNFKAVVRNGQYVLASNAAADGVNYIVYDSANPELLVEDNNKFDLGLNLYTEGGDVIACDTVFTDIGNDWTEVEFSFVLDEAITVDKLALEAHHVLEDETITMVEFPATASGAKFTAENVAAANAYLNTISQKVMLNYKNIVLEYSENAPITSIDLSVVDGSNLTFDYNMAVAPASIALLTRDSNFEDVTDAAAYTITVGDVTTDIEVVDGVFSFDPAALGITEDTDVVITAAYGGFTDSAIVSVEIIPGIDGAGFAGAHTSSRNYNFQEGNKYMYVSGRKELGSSKLYIYSFGFSDATYTIQYDIASPFIILNATLDSNAGRFYSSGLGKNPNNVLYLRGRDSNWYTVTGHNYLPLGSDMNNMLNIGARPPFYGWGLNNGADFDGYDYKIDNIKLVNEAGVTVFNFDFDTVEARGGGGIYYMTVEDTVIDGVTYKGGTLVLQNYAPLGTPAAEDLRANLSIVTDETYYAASTDANHEVAYDYNETLAAGVHTFKATVRNGEYILAASSAADGTTNYIVYDSANYGLLVENNNKFDLGFNLYTAGGEVIKADAVFTDIGNDWTNVEFTFVLDEATTIEKLAFEAHHALEDETITMVEFPATASGAKFTAEQVALANEKLNARTQTVAMEYKNITKEYSAEIPEAPECAHEWDEGVETLAPTCTADGVTTYTCGLCGETKTEAIPATGEHAYGDWTKLDDEYHTAACACGDTKQEAHDWDEGVETLAPTVDAEGVMTYTCSVCKGTKTESIDKLEPEEPEVLVDENLVAQQTAIQFGAYIGGQIVLKKASITNAGYESVYVTVEKNGVVTTLTENIGASYNQYVFEAMLAAKEMGDTLTITPYGVKDGKTYKGVTITWSIKEGIMSRLETFYKTKDTNAKHAAACTLLVDMLNYGAEAQIQFNHNADKLVNAGLDEKYAVLATAGEPTMTATNTTPLKTNNELLQYSVGLESIVNLQFIFKLPSADATGYSVVVEFNGETYTYETADLTVAGKNVVAVFDKLVARQMRDNATATLYKDGVAVSQAYTASIESVAKDRIGTKFESLAKALMVYGDSASVYFTE